MSINVQEEIFDIELEMELAHRDYELRKHEIITKLLSIRNSEINNDVMKIWINQAINFINERQI